MSKSPERDKARSLSALDMLASESAPEPHVENSGPRTVVRARSRRGKMSSGQKMAILVAVVLIFGAFGMARLGATDNSCERFNALLEPNAGTPTTLVFGIDQVTNSQGFAHEVAGQVASDLRRVSVDAKVPLVVHFAFTVDGRPRIPDERCLAEPLVLLPRRGDLASYEKGSESSRTEMQGRMNRTRSNLIDEVSEVVAGELRATSFDNTDPVFSPRELWDAVATTVGMAASVGGPVHAAITSTWISTSDDCLNGEPSAPLSLLVRDCVNAGAMPRITAQTVSLHLIETLVRTASQRFDATGSIDAFCAEATTAGCVTPASPSTGQTLPTSTD